MGTILMCFCWSLHGVPGKGVSLREGWPSLSPHHGHHVLPCAGLTEVAGGTLQGRWVSPTASQEGTLVLTGLHCCSLQPLWLILGLTLDLSASALWSGALPSLSVPLPGLKVGPQTINVLILFSIPWTAKAGSQKPPRTLLLPPTGPQPFGKGKNQSCGKHLFRNYAESTVNRPGTVPASGRIFQGARARVPSLGASVGPFRTQR